MASNSAAKLLPARARLSTALQQANATSFTPRMTAAVQALVEQQQKKRKKPPANGIPQNPTQLGSM